MKIESDNDHIREFVVNNFAVSLSTHRKFNYRNQKKKKIE